MGRRPGPRERRLTRRLRAPAIALVVAAAALVASCSGGGDATVASDRTAPVIDACDGAGRATVATLCASAGTLRAGDRFETWVAGDTATSRGLGVTLEEWHEGDWRTAATLVAPLPHGDGEPSYTLGDAPAIVLAIGIFSDTRLRYVMPPVAAGRYRLSQDLSVENPDDPRRRTVHRELTVVR